MVSREHSLLAGVTAAALIAVVGAAQVVVAQVGERTISLYNIHTKETVTVAYKKGGKYIEAGLERVNHALRDHRRNETTKMDPELVDLLWEMHSELGSKEPIHIISGYRSKATNEQLRRTVGGQASESRHILGKAADVHFPDVPVKNLRYSALVREKGGVGYYPTSAIPFVHVDTDRVRAWPRLPRYELALLFPSGQTRHAAADGGPITKEDVRVAQAKYRDVAQQIAAFHDSRGGGPKVAVAAATPTTATSVVTTPTRQQVAAVEPRLVEAPVPITATEPKRVTFTPPSSDDKAKLAFLAAQAIEPKLISEPRLAVRPPKVQSALPSLAGPSGPVPAGILQVVQPPAPKVAAIDPASLQAPNVSSDVGRFAASSGNWMAAPAYDDEHPEELSYRPFPIGPLLTLTAKDPVMSELVHHDVARTVDMIDQEGTVPPLRFRPSEQAAQALWSQQQFTGEANGLNKLQAAQTGKPTGGVQSRSVRTTK